MIKRQDWLKRIRAGKDKNRICTMAVLVSACLLFLTACSEAQKAYKDGVALMEKEDYEAAADSFEIAIKENKEKAEYYIAYGMSLLKDGRAKESIKVFGKAIQDKDNKIVRENNKQAYRGRGLAYYACHEYEKAVADYKEALAIGELEELDVGLLGNLADAMQVMGDDEGALESYDKLVEMNKKDEHALFARALLKTKMEQYEEAIDDFDRVIAIDKKNYNAYFGKYEAYQRQGDDARADEVLTAVTDMDIKSTEDKYQAARAYFYKGDYGTAESYLSEVLEEGETKAWYFLGQISQAKPDYEKAVQQYEQYIAQTDTLQSAMVYNQLAGCLMEQEEYVRALGYAIEGLKLQDRDAQQSLQYNTIIIYEKLGEFKKARKMAKEYQKAYPEDEDIEKELKFIRSRIVSKAQSKTAQAGSPSAVDAAE